MQSRPAFRNAWNVRFDASGVDGDLAFVEHDGKVFFGFPARRSDLKQYDALRAELGDLVEPAAFRVAVEVARRYVPEREWYLPLEGMIVDAGADLGYRAMRFARRGRVIAVEAATDNFAVMRRNIDVNRVDVHAVHRELGDTAPGTLDTILDESDVDRADYANIDVRGAEVWALRGLTRGRVKTVRVVCSEATFDECRRVLEGRRARILDASTTKVLYASFDKHKRKPPPPPLQRYDDERTRLLGDTERYRAFIRAPADADVLHGYLEWFIDDALRRAGAEPDGAARIFAWGWGYAAEAALTGYVATQQERFVDLVVSSFAEILRHRDSETGRRDDILGRSLRSWGGLQRMGKRKHLWIGNATIAGRICFPVAQLCRLITTRPALDRYAEASRRFLDAIEAAMGEFTDELVHDTTRDEMWIDRHFDNKLEPANHASAVANAFLALSLVTGKDEYAAHARRLANFLKGSLRREDNGAYAWRFAPAPEDRWRPDRERIWKGAVTVWLPLLAFEHGVTFDRDDMDAFADTFLKTIWRGDTRFHQYVEGDDYVPFEGPIRQEQNRAINLVGWIYLDRFRPQIRKIIETAVAERTDVFTAGWLQHPIGARTYAYRLFDDPEDYWTAWR